MANFGKLVSFCSGYGVDYNPSNSEIALAALTTIQTDSQNAINTVNTSQPAYNYATVTQEAAFKPLSNVRLQSHMMPG